MSREQLTSVGYLQKMSEFGNLRPIDGASNFVISGDIQPDSEWVIDVGAGLFPGISSATDAGVVIVTTIPDDQKSAPYYHSQILRMELPERVKNLGVPDIDTVRQILTQRSLMNGWPTIMITFSHYLDTGKQFVTLQCITGISPQTALNEFQKVSQRRLISFQ